MANTTLEKKVQVNPSINKLTEPMLDSAREIWFAGLGVFSVAQQESGKLIGQGNRLFDKLVSEGTRLEKKTLNVAETAVGDLKGEVESQFNGARQLIGDNWDGIGHIFDERVMGTLERLGIPTGKELNKLSGRVQKMSRQAVNNWKEFETAFEARVRKVLEDLGVPEAADLNTLSDKLHKVSTDAATSLAKLDEEIGARVSGAISGLEASTAKEVKRLEASVEDMAGKISNNWSKLESLVDTRVAQTLGKNEMPMSKDISRLSADLQKLSRQVAAIEKQLKVAAKPKVRKATPKKAPASKVVTTN